MAWSGPSIFAQLTVMLGLWMAFAYLYWHDHQGYLLKWAISWTFWMLKLLSDILSSSSGLGLLKLANLVCWLLASFFLVWGTMEISEKKMPRFWALGTLLAVVWSIDSVFWAPQLTWQIVPLFVFLGTELVWAGVELLKRSTLGPNGRLIGLTLILWGLHLADFPVLSRVAWFAPWGYDLATLLAMLAAFGDLALYYQRIRQDLSNSKDEIARMENARRHLVTNVSHDLRTPITSIQGYVEALLDGVIEEPEERTRYLRLIHNRVLGLNRLIQDLFDLVQLESRRMPFNFEPTPIGSFLRQVCDRYQVDAEKAGLNLLLESSAACGDSTVAIDKDRMDQVFANLLANALKYTPAGGAITIGCEPTPNRQEIAIRVQDTGTGIAEEDQPYVFDRFYRGSKSRSTSTAGTGLGLAIMKEIVETHHGCVWVESTPGQGTTFRFTLPVSAQVSQK